MAQVDVEAVSGSIKHKAPAIIDRGIIFPARYLPRYLVTISILRSLAQILSTNLGGWLG